MPFKEKKSGQWVGKITVNGVQHWCGRHDTKKLAREAEERKRVELNKRGLFGDETCDSFAYRWTDDYPRPKESTNRHNRERVRKFAEEFKGMKLGDVNRPMARRWALMNAGHLSAVRAMFTDAVNDGLCEQNPFTGLRTPQSRGRKDIVALTESDLLELADCALAVHGEDYGREFRALVLFAAYVGCRPGELMMLRPQDVRGGSVFISEQRAKHGGVTTPKNNQARVVICPPPAQEALGTFERRSPEWLFLSKTGRPFSHGTLFYAWNPVRQRYGRPDLDFYEITRHFCATHLLELGVSHADVAVQLGHRDGGALVMSTYGHPSEDLARQRLMAAFQAVDAGVARPLRSVGGK